MVVTADNNTMQAPDETVINTRCHVTKVLQDGNGMIWFSTWNGLMRYDGYKLTSFKPKAGDGSGIMSDRIRDITLASDGNIICRIDDEAFLFDIKTFSFRALPKKEKARAAKIMINTTTVNPTKKTVTVNGVEYRDVYQVFVDRQGNHWLKYQNEVVKIPNIMRHGVKLSALDGDVVRCIYRDREGRVWISGRNKKQLAVFDKSLNLLGYMGNDGNLHPTPVEFASVYAIHQTNNGMIWIGAKPEGLYRLTPTASKSSFRIEHITKSVNPSVCVESAYSFAIDNNGRLWIATNQEGLIAIENPDADNAKELRGTQLLRSLKNYPSDAVRMRKVMIRKDGTLIASTMRGLLVIDNIYVPLHKLKFKMHTREADNKESLSACALMSIHDSEQYGLYIGTESGGVNHLLSTDIHAEHLSFHHFNENNGLGMDVAQGLLMLPNGKLLVQCSYGVSVIDTKDGKIDNYGMNFWNSKAPFSDCNPLLLDDGRLVFGMTDGVLSLPLNKLSQHGYSPRIVLTSLSKENGQYDYSIENKDTIRLSPSERNISLSFAALDYRTTQALLYRTRMSPNASWSAPFSSNELILNNLQPGTYKFQICSTNADEQWTNNVRTLTIIVEPTFFEAWYGILCLILIGIGITCGVVYSLLYIRNINIERSNTREAYLSLLAERDRIREEQQSQSTSINEIQSSHGPTLVSSLSNEDEAFMNRLMSFIEQNMGNSDASVNDMADATATSRSGLSRRLHDLLGVTPADFLREARLKKAAQMLMDTQKSVAEISYTCGFSDPKYFTKTFKAKYGITPRDYRENA